MYREIHQLTAAEMQSPERGSPDLIAAAIRLGKQRKNVDLKRTSDDCPVRAAYLKQLAESRQANR